MNKCKDTCAHGLEELTLLKCPSLTKTTEDLIQPPSKCQRHFPQTLTNNNNKNPKMYMKTTKDLKSQSNLEEE